MRVTPINSAEAVFEPFFDEQLSELDQWTCDASGAIGLKLTPSWAFTIVDWEKPAADGLVLRMQRSYESLNCTNYDRLIVAINLPEDSTITLSAETDAGPRIRKGTPCGATRHEEWLPLEGAKHIHSLTVEVHTSREVTGSAWLLWFGLQSTERLPHHLAQWEGYDEKWDKYLQPIEFEPTFKPTYGLMLDAKELDEVRKDLATTDLTHKLREVGEIARAVRPESLIAENINFWNFNGFRRERDIGKMITMHGPFAAQAGVLWKDKELCRHAARFALSLVHCDHWEDIFFAWMRGSNWDQRGFVQSMGVLECSMILDLCGEWFTPLGRELILRRISTEGHGAMCQASWWWEYMYHTNQMIWISPARLYGSLILEKTMPVRCDNYPRPAQSRVAPHTEIIWGNVQDNLELALLPDGGYVEGAAYFTWVAKQVGFASLLYARGREQDPRKLVPPSLFKTNRLAEMLLSTDDGQDMLLTGDAAYAVGDGLAFLAWFMPESHWVTIYRKSLKRAGAGSMLLSMKLNREIPERGPAPSSFIEMPDLGYMASVRKLGNELVKLFILGNKAGGDHQHEDKGSFILECAGDSFAFDFGSVDYSNPVSILLKQCQRHNMLTPWSETERPCPANPIRTDVKPQGSGDETSFHATIDATAGWEGWFTQWHRPWDSPTPDTIIITDKWAVEKGEGAIFHWTTRLPIELKDGRVIIRGRRARAEFDVPEGVEATIDQLPLLDPRRRTIDDQRNEHLQFGWAHAETQPRLTLRQRDTSGTLQIKVQLTLL